MELFDGEGAQEEAGELVVNAEFAKRFEKRKKSQELARLRALHGDLGDDDASSEDEDGKLLTKELDFKILQAIDRIRQKKPEVYSKEGFFPHEEGEDDASSESEGGGEDEEAGSETASAPVTVRDHLRERGASALDSGDESGGDSAAEGVGGAARIRQRRQLAYDAEQQELRRALSVKLAQNDEKAGNLSGNLSGNEGSDYDDDDLLVRREVPAEERDAEADEYAAWLKSQLSKEGAVDEAVTLRRYMLDDNLDESETFLRDYMLNAMWKRPAKAETAAADQPEGWEGAEDVGPGLEEDGEEGDTFSDREDNFERAHNFRFEEAGADRVVSHPRQVEGSLRRQAELGRKREATAAAKARKEELRAMKAAELKRLKNLKKAELRERLLAIQKVAGVESLDGLDLSGDFDPDQWDRQMSAIFNSDYYAQPDEAMRAEMEAGDGDGDWDGEGEKWTEEGGEGEDVSGKRKRGGRRAKRGGGLEEAAAVTEGSGNAAAAAAELRKTTQEVMDEYYGLDYEDVIGQGESAIATRFKYRKVEPTSFGVSDAELLTLDDKDLSKRVPMRFVKRPYAQYDGRKIKSRAKRAAWAEEAQRREAERISARRKKLTDARAAAAAAGKRKRASSNVHGQGKADDGGALQNGLTGGLSPAGTQPSKGAEARKDKKLKLQQETGVQRDAPPSKKSVAPSRLAAFAQVNKRSKKEMRLAQKQRKKGDASAGPSSKWV